MSLSEIAVDIGRGRHTASEESVLREDRNRVDEEDADCGGLLSENWVSQGNREEDVL
jgi:hypothetical protein